MQAAKDLDLLSDRRCPLRDNSVPMMSEESDSPADVFGVVLVRQLCPKKRFLNEAMDDPDVSHKLVCGMM